MPLAAALPATSSTEHALARQVVAYRHGVPLACPAADLASRAACAFLRGCRLQARWAACLHCGQAHITEHAAPGCKLAQDGEQARGAASVPQAV